MLRLIHISNLLQSKKNVGATYDEVNTGTVCDF